MEWQKLGRGCLKIMERNPELKWSMRVMIIKWLSEVCADMNFKRETFHNACSIFDRYLLKVKKFKKEHLQILALTC